MKIRIGFVSNSSSSNFVLAVPKENNNLEITLKFDIRDLVDTTIVTKKELDIWATDYYGKREHWSDYEVERYNTYLNALEQGKIILEGTISNDSCGDTEGIELMLMSGTLRLRDMLNSEDIEVLQDIS